MLKSQAIHPSHEDLIVQRYEWLLRWALEICSGDRQEAEDLVQEAYVHFTLDRHGPDSGYRESEACYDFFGSASVISM